LEKEYPNFMNHESENIPEPRVKRFRFPKKRQDKETTLEPEAYSAEGAKREISLTEKELNALIAKS
jgi:hypothetical protein